MARHCQICDKKGNLAGRWKKLRGKYNPTGKRKQKPNLQWLRVPENIKREPYRKLAGKRVLSCTKCMKAIGKNK